MRAAATLVVFMVMGVVLVGGLELKEKDLESDEAMWRLYDRWIEEHGLERSKEEQIHGFSAFRENAQMVYNFNKNEDRLYEEELNEFADMTESEFRQAYSCIAPQPQPHDEDIATTTTTTVTHDDDDEYLLNSSLPSEVDWRKQGAVTDVKRNSNCGM